MAKTSSPATTQVQITKPVSKAPAKSSIPKVAKETKAKIETKVDATPAKVETKPETKTPTNRIQYALKEGFRPSGTGPMGMQRLKAHTHAFMNVSGLIDGGVVPTTLPNEVIGSRACAHHASKFETVASTFDASGKVSVRGGKKLTAEGKAFFAARMATEDKAMRSAYENLMTTGQPDGEIVKNASGVYKIA